MKANSERVRGKNFREFCGKPLFRWMLDTLLAVEEIDQVIINTDAREILAQNGLIDSDRVTIRDRKPEICGDFVSMNLVIGDDIATANSLPVVFFRGIQVKGAINSTLSFVKSATYLSVRCALDRDLPRAERSAGLLDRRVPGLHQGR